MFETFSLPVFAALSVFAKGPVLQELGPDAVSIRFELATPAPATVEIEPDKPSPSGDAGSRQTVADATPQAYHAVRVGNLLPGTRYRYAARAQGATERGTFTTAPAPGSTAPFSFTVVGDNRSDAVAHAAVVRAIAESPSDFLVHTGDFVQDGANPDDWQTFFDVERRLLSDRCLFACVGNHELLDNSGAAYLRWFGPRPPTAATPANRGNDAGPTERERLFWTFRWASARFFMLNAFDAWVSTDERTWLDAELARARSEPGVTYRIAVIHHAPWSSGPHGPNARLLSAGVHEVLARSGVDLVLGGHDHIYERGYKSNLRYVISGGGGAPLYRLGTPHDGVRKAEAVHHFVTVNVAAEGVRLTSKRVDGSVIESCGFRAGSPASAWDCDAPPPTVAETVAPPPPPPPASKCGCTAVGARGSRAGVVGVPLALLLAAARRRRRRRSGMAVVDRR